MDAEIDHEMTRVLIKNIGQIVKEVTVDWNKVFPPFRVTIPTHNADLKYKDVTLEFELPKSPFTTHYYQDFKQNRSKDLLMPLMCLDLEELKILLFEDEACTNRERQAYCSIQKKVAQEFRLLFEQFESDELDKIEEFDDVHSSLYTRGGPRISLVRRICYDMGIAVSDSERGTAALLCMNT
jgi:hypothetical protein